MNKKYTNIYHIVHFPKYKLLYLFFSGCNFNCQGCILKDYPWDYHLNKEIQQNLTKKYPNIRKCQLSLQKLEEILKRTLKYTTIERVALGGGEPTIDTNLFEVIKSFKKFKISKLMLLSNGYLLDEEMCKRLLSVGIKEVTVSIKMLSDAKHKYYTGKSNKNILNNLKILQKYSVKLYIETVFIPGFVDIDEIQKIAKYIASINPDVIWTINDYLPVRGSNWRAPTKEEIQNAILKAKHYIKNVFYLPTNEDPGKIYVIYPSLDKQYLF